MIVYDCEIKKAILGKRDVPIEGIEYCKGWSDHIGMGISVICAYDFDENAYRVFCEDNLNEFQDLVNNTDIVVGFNSIAFDNMLCLANDVSVPEYKSYDILVEMWVADGLAPHFQYPSHIGYSLDATCAANGVKRKTGSGAMAPVDWQRGKYGSVIDYCLNDVKMTRDLLELVIIQDGRIQNPKDISKQLTLRLPNG